jgi:8-amino-7-oxononanoate synthase
MSWNLQEQAADWQARGLWRHLRELQSAQGPVVRLDGREVLNFSSNDYLGLADAPALREALLEGVQRHGAGAGASRLVCGTHSAHLALERQIADFKGAQAALVFGSGFATALGVIPALVGSGDTVILDKLCHASLVDAARLSGATLRVFPHNHLGRLEKLLQGAQGRVLIVTESIFSMDGDRCPLADIVALKKRHAAWLLLDEAHAVGVIGPQGRGLAAELGLETEVELQMGTLSKALGLSGGYVAARQEVIGWLVNRARSFVYSTAMPPALAHAAGRALELAVGTEGDARRARLMANLRLLGAGDLSQSAILPWIIGEETAAVAASDSLLADGFLIPAIRYPTVARGTARLRITCTASHTAEHITMLRQALQCWQLIAPTGKSP